MTSVPSRCHLLVALCVGSWALRQRMLALLSPAVIAVCVKEEHLDTALPDKTPGLQLPMPVENIKQEMDH